jgi:CelD/BcsL family acetyltransferase involved in cellulose biosynthesis
MMIDSADLSVRSAAPSRLHAVKVTVVDDIGPLEAEWRTLERLGACTNYQTFAWQETFQRHAAASFGRPVFVTARCHTGSLLAIAPLIVSRRGPLKIAQFMGGDHSNYNMCVWHPDFAAHLDSWDVADLLQQMGRAIGVDMLDFRNQPHAWEGFQNPLALVTHQTSPSHAYRFALGRTCEAVLNERFSKDSLGKLRRKERRLSEIGPLRYVMASTPAEVDAILDAFLEQKTLRFQHQGIADAYADPGIRAFLREAATRGVEQGTAPVQLFGLFAGEQVIATFGASVSSRRFSGMFTSFEASRDISRFSPGDLLLMHIVKQMCRRGLETFDLGIGEAQYKERYCDVAERLFDTPVGITATGRAAAVALQATYRVKRHIKQDPRLMSLVTRWRQYRGRQSSQPATD